MKELKTACSQYGHLAPYTLTLLDSLNEFWMTTHDWNQVTKSCLSGGNYLLWKTDFESRLWEEVKNDKISQQPIGLSMTMLMGEGRWKSVGAQTYIPPEGLKAITNSALAAWRGLPVGGAPTTTLASIKQKADESYEDFVARLQTAVNRLISNEEVATILLKQLAFEGANSVCQALLRPIRKTGNVSDFIRQCADVGPAYVQGVAIAAALKGETYSQFIQGAGKGKGVKGASEGFKSICFSCGQTGHISKGCPQGNTPQAPALPKGPAPTTSIPSGQMGPKTICPRCQKGFHWAKECKSKFHKNGQLLNPGMPWAPPQIPEEQPPQQGNGNWGPTSRAPTTIGRPVNKNPFIPFVPSQNSLEPPQEAQGWTCVPPPQQY